MMWAYPLLLMLLMVVVLVILLLLRMLLMLMLMLLLLLLLVLNNLDNRPRPLVVVGLHADHWYLTSADGRMYLKGRGVSTPPAPPLLRARLYRLIFSALPQEPIRLPLSCLKMNKPRGRRAKRRRAARRVVPSPP